MFIFSKLQKEEYNIVAMLYDAVAARKFGKETVGFPNIYFRKDVIESSNHFYQTLVSISTIKLVLKSM